MMFGSSILPSLQSAIFEGLDPRIFAGANGGGRAGFSLPELLPPPGSSPGYAGGHFGGFGRGPLQRWDPLGTPGGGGASDAPLRIDPGSPPGGILVDGQPADQTQAASQPMPSLDYMGGINESLARNAELGREHASQPKKKGFKDFLRAWAGSLGDSLTGNPLYAEQLKHEMRMRESQEEERRKAQLPQQVGSSVIVPDGQGGYRTVFRDPSTPEAYALAQGYQPGTPEYSEAVRQYRLGSWSDEAMDARLGLTGYRYDRMGNLQDDRQTHSVGMQEDRQQHSNAQLGRRLDVTRRGQDLTDTRSRRPRPAQAKAPSPTTVIGAIMDKQAGGQPLTAAEQRTYDEYRAGRGRGSRTNGSGADLIGPVYQRGGRRIQYSKKAGGYVDLTTGQRVN